MLPDPILGTLAGFKRLNAGVSIRGNGVNHESADVRLFDNILHFVAPLSFLCEYIIAYRFAIVNSFLRVFIVKFMLTTSAIKSQVSNN